MRILLSTLVVASSLWAQADSRELVRRSIVNGEKSWKLAQDYACTERDEERRFGPGGRVKSKTVDIYQVIPLAGAPYSRLVERNGKPLTGPLKQKEEQKFEKAREDRQAAAKRLANARKEREFLKEVPDAFNFKLAGEEQLPTGPAYVLEATPRPQYRPRSSRAKMFSKMRGKLWVDKKDIQWVKADAEAMDNVWFGFFIARLAKGSHIILEQTRLAGDLWVPKRLDAKASARIMLVKSYNFEENISYSNYHKPSAGKPEISAR